VAKQGKRALQERREAEFEEVISVDGFSGRNTFGQHSDLKPGEFRELINYEVYPKFIKNRRGSEFNRGAISHTVLPTNQIHEGIVWDTGAVEYLIFQSGSVFFSKNLTNPADAIVINDFAGSSLSVPNVNPTEMFIEDDRLYLMHDSGNKIIEFFSGIFKGRDLGMDKPVILDVSALTAGQLKGKYTVGIEKVYRKNGADFLVSSPNRRYTSSHATKGREINEVTATSNKIKITIEAADLDNDTLWTHIRIWRSFRQNHDLTDAANPIDAVGIPHELYEVALITKAELSVGSLTAIATSSDSALPAGNKDVEAGKPGGVYTIEDNVLDINLVEQIGLDNIEMIPLPGCEIGTYHAERIWCSKIGVSTFADGTSVSDDSKNQIYYSSNVKDKYRELFKINQFIKVKRDGESMMKLISFEKDLIAIKEAKTLRLPDGDINLPIEAIDSNIGISHKRLAAFVPQLGICAKVNDFGDFRILGFDFVWRSTFNGLEISQPIREDMAAVVPTRANFNYMNGKLFFSNGLGQCHVLNVEAGRGWSLYEYRVNSYNELVVLWANGTKGLMVSQSEHLISIDVEGLTTDADINKDTNTHDIDLDYTTWKYQHSAGESVLEQQHLSIMGTPTRSITIAPFANDVPWPSTVTESYTPITVNPETLPTPTGLLDKLYRLFLEPQAIGNFLWNRMIGNFLHYRVKTIAPCIMKSHKLHCIVDTDGYAFGDFDLYQTFGDAQTDPSWTTDDTTTETGTATDTITETGTATDTITEDGP
jgi:hypothetical protein